MKFKLHLFLLFSVSVLSMKAIANDNLPPCINPFYSKKESLYPLRHHERKLDIGYGCTTNTVDMRSDEETKDGFKEDKVTWKLLEKTAANKEYGELWVALTDTSVPIFVLYFSKKTWWGDAQNKCTIDLAVNFGKEQYKVRMALPAQGFGRYHDLDNHELSFALSYEALAHLDFTKVLPVREEDRFWSGLVEDVPMTNHETALFGDALRTHYSYQAPNSISSFDLSYFNPFSIELYGICVGIMTEPVVN